MSFCMILNFGIATFMRNSITTAMASTAATMIQPMERFVRAIMMMPPMAKMGAYRIMRSIMTDTICTCCTSLVPRVISEAEACFSVRNENIALEIWFLQTAPIFRRRGSAVTHDYGDDHAERGEAEHLAARGEQVIHLHGVQIVTELFIFGLGGGNRLLAHDGIGRNAHLRLRFIEHGLNVRFLHHAGVVSGFQLVEVHAGLVGVMYRNKRHGHGFVELRAMLAAEVGELVDAVRL